MRKFLKFILPLILIVASIAVVIALVAIQKSKSAERKPEIDKAVLVDVIEAEVRSLNRNHPGLRGFGENRLRGARVCRRRLFPER